MSAVIVVATVSPKPGEEQAVREAILAAIPKVHAEPGCGKYALHEPTGDSTDLVFVEKWESQEALETHSGGPALKELGGALKGKLAAPLDVRTFTAIPAGTAEQGTL
ncbi:putative quinol monooxygenase [Pseudonocardia pini]|uniref:putative quinol monooxygenase n=1 Tax=Pseudonocardia pini TaxID=2758030 RepID=UPI0015EFF5F1|nr:putative quinol monooxygenase [Pseudonocardia pini]